MLIFGFRHTGLLSLSHDWLWPESTNLEGERGLRWAFDMYGRTSALRRYIWILHLKSHMIRFLTISMISNIIIYKIIILYLFIYFLIIYKISSKIPSEKDLATEIRWKEVHHSQYLQWLCQANGHPASPT